MGLDMYLYKDTYVQNWDHMSDSEKHIITIVKDGLPVSQIKPERIAYIREQVGYWRKANSIHAWFVANVQDGNDDCGTYYVSDEKLSELLTAVREVLASTQLINGIIQNGLTANKETGFKLKPHYEVGKMVDDPNVAKELLPSQSGSFFGSTDYDEYYVADLKDTEQIIAQVIEEGGDVYYTSSW